MGMRSVAMSMVLAMAVMTTSARGEEVQRASDLRSNPGPFLRTSVAVEGFVTQYVDAGGAQAAFFYVKDDWGGLIRVQTKDTPPGVGRRYRVRGRLTLDTELKDPFLVEESRVELGLAAPDSTERGNETAPATGRAATSSLASTASRALPWVLGGLAIVAVGVVASRRRAPTRGAEAVHAIPGAAPAAPPHALGASDRIVEGRTMRIHLPPEHTVKILPGWLEVISDDTVKQILFYKTRNQSVPTITFGRAPGEPYSHVQLKPMTVSARQAQIVFSVDGPRLTNLATADSNPTKVNDRELGVGESCALRGGDEIAMGEVHFRFRDR